MKPDQRFIEVFRARNDVLQDFATGLPLGGLFQSSNRPASNVSSVSAICNILSRTGARMLNITLRLTQARKRLKISPKFQAPKN